MFKKILMLSAISLIALASTAFAEGLKEKKPARAALELVDIEAKVEAVDYEKREVLLRGPTGNLVTVEAGDEVKRLKEIKAGDIVKARYYTYLVAEFREPTAEEKANPLTILAESGKAIKELPPGAVVGALIKAVVSVEMIDRPDMMVTVKGPRGNYVSIPVADAKLMDELNIGEVVILTYAESVALTLKKEV